MTEQGRSKLTEKLGLVEKQTDRWAHSIRDKRGNSKEQKQTEGSNTHEETRTEWTRLGNTAQQNQNNKPEEAKTERNTWTYKLSKKGKSDYGGDRTQRDGTDTGTKLGRQKKDQ